jgi:hypothetical protein
MQRLHPYCHGRCASRIHDNGSRLAIMIGWSDQVPRAAPTDPIMIETARPDVHGAQQLQRMVPVEVVEYIAGKTDGAPIFTEELTKDLMLAALGLRHADGNKNS